MLPFVSHMSGMWLLAAAMTLISARIYFRDGPKTSSFVLMGMCLGAGLAGDSAFLAVLPWALIPAVAALRSGRAIARTLPLMLFSACIGWFTMRWWSAFLGPAIFSVRSPETILPGISPESASLIDLMKGLVSARAPTLGPSDALLAIAWGIATLGFLFGTFSGRGKADHNAPTRQLSGQWNTLWRLAPLLEIQLAAGLGTAMAWICGSVMLDGAPPAANGLLLLSPLLALAGGVGFANATDWLRRQRRVPNWPAEHPKAWGLALLSAANLLGLLNLIC